MRPFLRRFPVVGGLQLFALLCAALAGASSVEAATLIVTSTTDSGAGSLRSAIAAASDGDTIQFDAALNGHGARSYLSALQSAHAGAANTWTNE